MPSIILESLPFAFVVFWLLFGQYFVQKNWHLYLLIAVIPFVGQSPLYTILCEDFLLLFSQVFFAYSLAMILRIEASVDPETNANALTNTILLLIAGALSNILGTIGSSAIFAAALAKLNFKRKEARHVMIFFILLVSNVCGGLLPTGDPPLLIGMANGIPFDWMLRNAYLEYIVAVFCLILVFAILDGYLFSRDCGRTFLGAFLPQKLRIKLVPANRVSLIAIILAFIMLVIGMVKFITTNRWDNIVRISLLFTSILSIIAVITNGRDIKRAKHFASEIACIFLSTLVTSHNLEGIINSIVKVQEMSTESVFWCSGIMSSVMDNVPTYLLFFKQLRFDESGLMKLKAVSLASVFFGALTYTGNLPNIAVKEIAEANGIKLPMPISYLLIASMIMLPIMKLILYIIMINK